ncbi:Ig-like domain-containing domain [Pedobacter faecalis]|uniref:Ig-like domain-containing domain n=1 Tax=Pedobacter faecalis TaxID=3041495 RepID=UPI00254D1BE6|nr:Ig-like domain-containing domain [Pedobacter sp. ELA7]
MRNSEILFKTMITCMGVGLMYSCASIQQPQGGPRDETPPKVVRMLPEDKTVNFKSKEVIIEFDEYFKIQNEFKEFSVSPEMNVAPTLKRKQKSLHVVFADSALEANTTYTLNFGQAIADVNEGNAAKNLTYVFATGDKLDSLSIKGKVSSTQTGLPELDALVFLLPINRDTLLGKRRPSIYTYTDSSGNYSLNNLREDTYRIYALKEKNGDKIYQENVDDIAFLKDSIKLEGNLTDIDLNLFREDATQFRIVDKRIHNDGSISMIFNQKLKQPEIVVLDPPALDVSKKIRFNNAKDSLKIWLTDMSFDSTKISIKDQGKLLQTTTFNKGKNEKYTRTLVTTDNLEGGLLNPNKRLKLSFNLPIEKADVSKITLLEDSTEVSGLSIQKDSADFLSYYVIYPWKQKRQYDLNFADSAFTGLFNTNNKIFDKSFRLISKDEYGTLKVQIKTPEPDKQYILEIVDEGKRVINSLVVRQDTSVSYANYKGGKYFIRIVYDTNKNGVWDTGNVPQRRQPEKIWNEPKELSIRPLWERNEVITIPKE